MINTIINKYVPGKMSNMRLAECVGTDKPCQLTMVYIIGMHINGVINISNDMNYIRYNSNYRGEPKYEVVIKILESARIRGNQCGHNSRIVDGYWEIKMLSLIELLNNSSERKRIQELLCSQAKELLKRDKKLRKDVEKLKKLLKEDRRSVTLNSLMTGPTARDILLFINNSDMFYNSKDKIKNITEKVEDTGGKIEGILEFLDTIINWL